MIEPKLFDYMPTQAEATIAIKKATDINGSTLFKYFEGQYGDNKCPGWESSGAYRCGCGQYRVKWGFIIDKKTKEIFAYPHSY